MFEIWSPGTFFQGGWVCQISARYLLYFKRVMKLLVEVSSDFQEKPRLQALMMIVDHVSSLSTS